jgi:hypothetical protein
MTWDEPIPGDHWIYETRDEITGEVITQTNVLTEVTTAGIRVQINLIRPDNTNDQRLQLYDRSWNLLRTGGWLYFPNDGISEMQTPLTVGKTWAFHSKAVWDGGFTWDRSGSSTVVGQETVTTKAGTFETFRIETTYAAHAFKDPDTTEELTRQMWYAPSIAHWVKQERRLRKNDRLSSHFTIELAEFGRKP